MKKGNIKKQLIIMSLALTLLMLSGCNGGVITGGGGIRRELDALKMEVADLRDRSRLSGAPAASGGGGSDLRIEVDNIRTQLQRLTENVETASIGGNLSLRQQLEYISARLDRLEKKANLPPLSADVVAAPVPVMLPPAQSPPVVGDTEALPGTDPGTIPTQPAVDGQQPVLQPGAPLAASPPIVASAYDEGKALFDQKNYPAAIERFKAYLAAEPSGNQVPAAQFYIGESLYFQNQFETAILEYQTLVSGYPKNPLVSTALLKQGLAFQALGDTASAKLLYQKVVRDYPKSYSAGIARERLKTI
ncbi:MAG: tol-pal system protein YbgF [Deltaproteobacteria bacterium]|jgi:tol-pal system protein YbgF|nr:tol-pal system protein YbgF [Deltaproteobacteria bacterium]